MLAWNDLRSAIFLGVIQKLRWQDFGLFWPPTYPLLTFLKEFHHFYVINSTYPWHSPHHLATFSCQRSFWMTPNPKFSQFLMPCSLKWVCCVSLFFPLFDNFTSSVFSRVIISRAESVVDWTVYIVLTLANYLCIEWDIRCNKDLLYRSDSWICTNIERKSLKYSFSIFGILKLIIFTFKIIKSHQFYYSFPFFHILLTNLTVRAVANLLNP